MRTSGLATERAGRSRSGRVRLWVPLLCVLGGSLWALEGLRHPLEAAQYTAIDLGRVRLVPARGGYFDPRWQREVAAALAGLPRPDASDAAALRHVADRLRRLPFVAEVGEPRVLWPDGLDLPVRLCEPVACVRQGEQFVAVSREGVLLPGAWPEPPRAGERTLPVIGPNDGAFDRLLPGTRLAEPRHLDGLSVAISMQRSLDREDARTLGPMLIDASRARQTSVEEPGARLELEGARVVLFGRAPWSGEPGELPAELKWRSLSQAAALLRGDEHGAAQDWSVVDLRWDTPAIRLRGPGGDERAKPADRR